MVNSEGFWAAKRGICVGVKFSDLGMSPQMCKELRRAGFEEPFEVQMETIPDMMLKRDICCRAPTGSGKTLAFGIPMIEHLSKASPNKPKSLILTPTRELAEQIFQVLDPLAWSQNMKMMSMYGGVSYNKQIKKLDKGVDSVVACPGRLLDHIDQGNIDLSEVEFVILDEADRMSDMGFTDDVCTILDQCNPNRQTALFSATLDEYDVAHIRDNYLTDPVTISVGKEDVSLTEMDHHFWLIQNKMKSKIAAEAVRKSGRSFIFCRTRAGVERVAEELQVEGLRVSIIHGGLAQRQRSRAVEEFTEERSHAIVATDVAARGLDVDGVYCVIHYDPPENGNSYKHRSGRTARAGKSGTIISLVQNPQKKQWSTIQKHVGLNVKFKPPEFKDLTQHEDISYISPPRPMNRSRKDRSGRNREDDRETNGRHFGKRNWKKSTNNNQSDSGNSRGGNRRGGKAKFDRNKRPPKGPGRSRGRGGDNKRKSRNNH